MNKLKKFANIFISGLIIAFITYLTIPHFLNKNLDSHNCRFWGIIFSDFDSSLESIIRTQLDSLKSLGNYNPDGWGIGYYLSPANGVFLPIILRGEPEAPLDPRYDKVVDNMVSYIKKCGIAHVRSGTSGPTGGVPDPHPFQRDGISRDFQMLFAHNGIISEDVLLDLIHVMNPVYLDSNPPDYAPNYLDSDLYAIYLMEVIDTYLEYTIEECIQIAVTKLDSALGSTAAEFNFVMSNGSALWALHFTKPSTRGLTLYYYPDEEVSDFWVAASEPLDTFESYWAAVPNSTLVTLIPGQLPRLINVFYREKARYTDINEGLGLIYPNPFRVNTTITYWLSQASDVSMKIYNVSGRLVRTILVGEESPGYRIMAWDGKDNQGNDLPKGVYFCSLIIENTNYVKKIVSVK